MKKTFILSCFSLLFSSLTIHSENIIEYVNPIIGTNGMGHTFPGACVPFGVVQLSPDTVNIKEKSMSIVPDISIATIPL